MKDLKNPSFIVNFICVLFSCILFKANDVTAQFNMTNYRKMSPLFHMDDYDACLEAPTTHLEAPTYCMVFAEIAPNETSALWNRISNFSADSKRHFRHDHLFFGVCLESCRELLHPLSDLQKKQLYGGRVQDEVITEYYAAVHKRETDDRKRYDHEISSCLNYDFRSRYQLTLRTSIEYCEVANKALKYDTVDYLFNGIISLLILLNILSSIYDYNLKRKQPLNMQNNKFYQMDSSSKVDSLLTSFSICRNYYRITQPLRGETARNLRFFNTLRVFGTFFVILAHVLLSALSFQIENPYFIEKMLDRAEIAVIQNGTSVLHIFFIMSGFLLFINDNEKFSPNLKLRECIQVYLNLIVNRFLRFVPSLSMFMLFNATLLTRLQDGPFWRHATEAERVFCREYWWKNIFFVNNFLMERSCAHHLWYLAADMQIYALCSLVLIIVAIYPNLKKIIFTVIIILTIAVPALITYFFKLDAIYHMKPEDYRYLFFKGAETFYHSYVPFYTNISGYIFGIITAELYTKLKRNNTLNKYKGILKYELSWWLFFPIITALLFTGTIFMWNDFEKPSVWLSIYAGLYKNIWVIICCMCVLGMCLKLGWIAYEFCQMSIFEPLGKLSFQVYIWHINILRLLAYYRQPVYINLLYATLTIVLVFITAYSIAFIFALFLEFPVATFVKCLRKKSKANADKHVNNVITLQDLRISS